MPSWDFAGIRMAWSEWVSSSSVTTEDRLGSWAWLSTWPSAGCPPKGWVCQNLGFFSQALPPAEGSGGEPLSQRIFKARLELLQAFDAAKITGPERAEVAEILRAAVGSMNEANFLVRPHLELVERYRAPGAWDTIGIGDLAALADRLAKLPTQLEPEPEDAKRFDVVMLGAELGV